MSRFTAQQLKEASSYSQIIIQKAKNRDSGVFLVAKGGKRFFDAVDTFLAVDYIRQIEVVEYKLKELERYGSVYGEPMTKGQIMDELILVIQQNYGKLFKKILADLSENWLLKGNKVVAFFNIKVK